MSLETALGNTTCSKGHVHPPWNTTGVLSIAKCESICGFCQKETKTAANLRKHVAIHIKNEGLNLTIAEGSSGRGRLEMPTAQLHSERGSSISSSHISMADDDEMDASDPSSSMSVYQRPPVAADFSPSQVLMSMASRSSSSSYPAPTSYFPPSHSSSPIPAFSSPSSTIQSHSHLPPYGRHSPALDPFRPLREHHLSTKIAWTVIPAAEGFRILDLCKRLSAVSAGEDRVPCYNRETIFDEEWQAHMKDVHGVFLLWPETWMRRIEVLDLDAFGGDIGACNEVIMEGV
ncbi:uncharacterized protein K444DRAFT_531650 [Hyaloscypha bicolor E]|uniref:Uncharacterized protein n=1 Tax=Hyaloscypha bicolor E TaxID=1095630 RepID=A0A2J6T6B4_9HELO|nr:uncharacterized protein K444DRAFT_531650 [Hyaloscypha bicolor E]PMD58562.1 hypothetical protein K444DRAFT_531650 [Hyaloscypha bicolor E]